MSHLIVLIPIALLLGLSGLAAFVWCLKNGQYDDLNGAAHRILNDETMPPDEEQMPKVIDQKQTAAMISPRAKT